MPAGVKITADKVVTEIQCNSLADYQAHVGGLIEPIVLHTADTMFVNEENKFLGLPFNSIATDIALRVLLPGDAICGDVVIVGGVDAEGNEVDLSDVGRRWIKKVADEAGAASWIDDPTREQLVAEAQEQARIVRRTYDTDHRAYRAAESRLAKANARIKEIDEARERAAEEADAADERHHDEPEPEHDWYAVASASGIGTAYFVKVDLLAPPGARAYAVTVASGPAQKQVAAGLSWVAAMDRMRDEVAAELEAEGQDAGRPSRTVGESLRLRYRPDYVHDADRLVIVTEVFDSGDFNVVADEDDDDSIWMVRASDIRLGVVRVERLAPPLSAAELYAEHRGDAEAAARHGYFEAPEPEANETDTCPEHGEQRIVDYGSTGGPDPYAIQRLACGDSVACFGPGEPNVIVSTGRRLRVIPSEGDER